MKMAMPGALLCDHEHNTGHRNVLCDDVNVALQEYTQVYQNIRVSLPAAL